MTLPKEHDDQYKMLREEAVELANECRTLELSVIGGIAALYAWFATHRADIHPAAWFIGLPLALIAGIRDLALFRRIEEIADYLQQIESAYFHDPKLVGWERYRAAKGANNISRSSKWFWGLLLGLTFGAPFAFIYLPAPSSEPKPAIVHVIAQPPVTTSAPTTVPTMPPSAPASSASTPASPVTPASAPTSVPAAK